MDVEKAEVTRVSPDDLPGILRRAADQEDDNVAMHRGAVNAGWATEAEIGDVTEWCEKKAQAFRRAADRLAALEASGVRELVEALEDAREQLREYELAATGEDYNCQRINAVLSQYRGDKA